MDEFKVRLRIKKFNKIVPIEGGRYLRSQSARDELRSIADQFGQDLEFIAGFAIVCWDDDGGTMSTFHNEAHSPYQDREIPLMTQQALDESLRTSERDDTDEDETLDDEE